MCSPDLAGQGRPLNREIRWLSPVIAWPVVAAALRSISLLTAGSLASPPKERRCSKQR